MLLISCFIFFTGCDKEEPIPSYLHIDHMDLQVASSGEQGSSANDILDAWVYVGPNLIGVFELPATIPVLASGYQTITVAAGIKKNGLGTERIIYPFYKAYTVVKELIPAQIDTLNPTVKYVEKTTFPWLEDFEDGTISMKPSGVQTTYDSLIITENPSEVFEYDGISNTMSGKVAMPTGFQIFEVESSNQYDLPRSGQEIFLEFNFMCNTELEVGIHPDISSLVEGVPVVNFYSTADADGVLHWKKAYISLKEDVNFAAYQGVDFSVYFKAQTNTESGTPLIFLDNIKLIHY